jgi:hypothetical protein
LGGSGLDNGNAIALDGSGYIYVLGSTRSLDFPLTLTAFDSTGDALTDLFMAKIDLSKKRILYSTYLGGSSWDYAGDSIVVDDQNNLYLMVEETNSSDFPTKNARDPSYNGHGDMMFSFPCSHPFDMTLSGCEPDCAISSVSSDATGLIAGPINTRTGTYDYSYTDLALPTTAGVLSFQRVYSSQAVSKYNQLGPGWTHNHDTRLIFPSDPLGIDGQVLFKVHTANLYNFYEMGDGPLEPSSIVPPHPDLHSIPL